MEHEDAVEELPARATEAGSAEASSGAETSEKLACGDSVRADTPEKRACCMTTGDLARACETTVRTVRFDEEATVLAPRRAARAATASSATKSSRSSSSSWICARQGSR